MDNPALCHANVLVGGSAKSIALRLRLLAEGLRAVIAEYRPQEAALEEVFYGKDVGAAVRIGVPALIAAAGIAPGLIALAKFVMGERDASGY